MDLTVEQSPGIPETKRKKNWVGLENEKEKTKFDIYKYPLRLLHWSEYTGGPTS